MTANRLAGVFDVVVVTSAALPWRTGPSIIGLWHAHGLTENARRVAFGFPWLEAASQKRLWGTVAFAAPEEQARWMTEEAGRLGCPGEVESYWYRGCYVPLLGSIVPLEDVLGGAPPTRALVLEEPEHLAWYPWTARRAAIRAERVVGIVMTNYPYYIAHSGLPGARVLAPLVDRLHTHLIRTRTDVVVPLSPTLPTAHLRHPVHKAIITGALPAFFDVPPVEPAQTGVYFLGRLVWFKGLRTLIEAAARMALPIDVVGDGPDRAAMEALARDTAAPVRFLGHSTSPWERVADYRVFFNPSLSEVLCTATIEALAAGRRVVLPVCESNEPFLSLPNVHAYRNGDVEGMTAALTTAVSTLPDAPELVRREFGWPAGCRRLAALWDGSVPGTA